MNAVAQTESVTRATVEQHNARWSAGNLEGLFALYHPDMVFTDHYSGKNYCGAALRDHVSEVIRRSALDSLVYTDRLRVDGDTAHLQYSETIRSANGDELLTIRACDVVRVRQGLIVDIQEYAIPLQVDAGRRSPGVALAAEKVGLTARGLGYLLDDMATYISRDQPYLKPTLGLRDVRRLRATAEIKSRLRLTTRWAPRFTLSSTALV